MNQILDTPLLLARSTPRQLRHKLADPQSPLLPWWQHFLQLSRSDPQWFSPYTVLAAVVSGQERDRQAAREAFFRFVANKHEAEVSLDAQYHTHVVAAPLGRWAIFYDWMRQLGFFSPDEQAAIEEALLDFAFMFPLQQMQSRMRSFDNQVMGNAFGATLVGYVTGIKGIKGIEGSRAGSGQSALGRRLFQQGSSWLIALLGQLPPGGYSPEGSTYHEQVVLPMCMLSGLFLEEILGLPILDRGLPPDHRPLRQLLETSFRMIGPSGILPGWDAYGFQPATVKSGLALLARISGDPQPLQTLRHGDMWYRLCHPAWEIDDRLWTLLWWPDDLPVPQEPPRFDSFLINEVAGSLQAPADKIRLFQCWDACAGVPSSGRCQVDPNAVTFEAFDSVLLLDGYGKPAPELIPLPADAIVPYIGQRTLDTVIEYINSAWGAKVDQAAALRMAMDGSVGLANALVFDGETWYVPLGPRTGSGEALHLAGPLHALRASSLDFYRDRYDVSRITRSSLLVAGRYALLCDRVTSATPHQLTWQAYLRRDAALEDGRTVIRTAEQVRCDVIPLGSGAQSLTDVAHYPRCPEDASQLFQWQAAADSDVRLDLALVPQRQLENIADVTAGWQRQIAGRTDRVDLNSAYLSDTGENPEESRVFTRQCNVTKDPQRRYFLSLGISNRHLRLLVNGRNVAPVVAQSSGTWDDSSCYYPFFFDITDALTNGGNELRLEARYFHGETLRGPAELGASRVAQRPEIQRLGPAAFACNVGGQIDQVLMENEAGLVDFAGGKTDARYAVITADGTVAVAQATTLSQPGGLRIAAVAPVDLAWDSSCTRITSMIEGMGVELTWPGASLRVDSGGCILITSNLRQKHRLSLSLPGPRQVIVNGVSQGILPAPQLQIDLPAGAAQAPAGHAPRTAPAAGRPVGAGAPAIALAPAPAAINIAGVEALYAAGQSQGAQAAPLLLAALAGDDWRLQVAAADLAGQLGVAAAVPVMLELFAQSEAELPYPPLTKWWSHSKMLHRPEWPTGEDPTLPRPLGIKRWRVKRAVITALGKLGDQRAAAPLEAALRRCNDFFPVTSQLAVALGRIGARSSIAVLELHQQHAEINTRVHARLSLALLQGQISRSDFEARVGIN